jgi:hypothetical protein
LQQQREALKLIEAPENLINRVLEKYCLGQKKPTMTREMLEDSQKYANREMTEADYFEMKEKYDKKTFLNLFFEGSPSLMELTESAFTDQKFETEMIKKGIHPLIVDEDEAKFFHSKEYGTHSPVISTHHIRIGTPHGISRTEVGLLSDLYKSGYLQEITPEALIAYALEEKNRVVRVDTAKKICKEINKQRRDQVSGLIDGRVGEDSMTKKSLEIISKKGMAEGWSFEKVNNYGVQARRLVKLMNDDFGKEIGNMVTKQNLDNKEELAANHMDHICKQMGIAMDDMLAVAWHKMIGRKKKKNGI